MRRLLFLLAIPSMIAVPFLTAGKAEAQVSFEIQGHSSFALEELSRLADGTGVGGLVAVTYPILYEGMLNVVGKVGFNHYGSKVGDVEVGSALIPVDSAYRGIPVAAGARLYYGQDRLFYAEGLLGLEIKRGDLDYLDSKGETSTIAPVLSVGAGYTVAQGLALIASFGMSNDLWRYANLGVSYRFGE